MRCAFAIDDDLHAFAQSWLAEERRNCYEMLAADGALVFTVFREGRFQVERCHVPPGMVIPTHVHPAADTIEVGVAGAVRLLVRGADPFARVPDRRLGQFTRRRGIRINHDDPHGGRALSDGAVFYSIQRWAAGPRSVLTDYVGERLGAQHRGLQ